MFNVNDRVVITRDQATKHYHTVTEHFDDEMVIVVADDSPCGDEGVPVYHESICHVTNVPTVAPAKAATRTFDTGATRDTDEGKLDFEGFLSPSVIKAFAEYMHTKRKMPDGSMRDADNWQKGIPLDAYMKSMWRHFFDTWESHRKGEIYGDVIKTELLALLFNVQGYLHEILKAQHVAKD